MATGPEDSPKREKDSAPYRCEPASSIVVVGKPLFLGPNEFFSERSGEQQNNGAHCLRAGHAPLSPRASFRSSRACVSFAANMHVGMSPMRKLSLTERSPALSTPSRAALRSVLHANFAFLRPMSCLVTSLFACERKKKWR